MVQIGLFLCTYTFISSFETFEKLYFMVFFYCCFEYVFLGSMVSLLFIPLFLKNIKNMFSIFQEQMIGRTKLGKICHYNPTYSKTYKPSQPINLPSIWKQKKVWFIIAHIMQKPPLCLQCLPNQVFTKSANLAPISFYDGPVLLHLMDLWKITSLKCLPMGSKKYGKHRYIHLFVLIDIFKL